MSQDTTISDSPKTNFAWFGLTPEQKLFLNEQLRFREEAQKQEVLQKLQELCLDGYEGANVHKIAEHCKFYCLKIVVHHLPFFELNIESRGSNIRLTSPAKTIILEIEEFKREYPDFASKLIVNHNYIATFNVEDHFEFTRCQTQKIIAGWLAHKNF